MGKLYLFYYTPDAAVSVQLTAGTRSFCSTTWRRRRPFGRRRRRASVRWTSAGLAACATTAAPASTGFATDATTRRSACCTPGWSATRAKRRWSTCTSANDASPTCSSHSAQVAVQPDLQNVFGQSYDYPTTVPNLRSTYDGHLVYKTCCEEREAFLGYDSLAKL